METSHISFELSTNSPTIPLAFEAWINDQCIFKTDHVTETHSISFELDVTENTDHSLRLIMNGKKLKHTRIDSAGNITHDAKLFVNNVCVDEIEIDQLLFEHAVYSHNFNGTREHVNEKFFGEFGCNGTVELKFTSPIYLWLLENT